MRGADRPHPDDRHQAALRLLELQAEGQAALDSLQDAVMEVTIHYTIYVYSESEIQTTVDSTDTGELPTLSSVQNRCVNKRYCLKLPLLCLFL